MRYLAVIRRSETGFSVDVPSVPGCVATGRSVEQARQRIAGALGMHLELLRESGQRLPKSSPRTADMSQSEDEEYCTWVEVETPQPVA